MATSPQNFADLQQQISDLQGVGDTAGVMALINLGNVRLVEACAPASGASIMASSGVPPVTANDAYDIGQDMAAAIDSGALEDALEQFTVDRIFAAGVWQEAEAIKQFWINQGVPEADAQAAAEEEIAAATAPYQRSTTC